MDSSHSLGLCHHLHVGEPVRVRVHVRVHVRVCVCVCVRACFRARGGCMASMRKRREQDCCGATDATLSKTFTGPVVGFREF